MPDSPFNRAPRRRPARPLLLNGDGLHLNGTRYNSPDLQDLRARFSRLFHVRVHLSPERRVVTLLDPDTQEVLAVAYAPAAPRPPVPCSSTKADVDAALDALQSAMERVRRLLEGRRRHGPR